MRARSCSTRPSSLHPLLLFSKSHGGKGANGSKNRPPDAYPVRCRVPGYYEPCSERVRVCQLKKCRQLKHWPEKPVPCDREAFRHRPSSLPPPYRSTLSSKVNLPHATNFRAVCGALLVTLRSNESLEVHRVLPRGRAQLSIQVTASSPGQSI